MKLGIVFVSVAALALTAFAVPYAEGKSGPGVDQRISGSSFVIDVDDETGNTTSRQNLLAKGKPGTAQVTSQLEFGPPLGIDERCPRDFPFGADLISFSFVETFNDGSLLTGAASPGQAVCSDGFAFVADMVGVLTGGTGRFEGAAGTWAAFAATPGENSGATGTFTADFD